MINIFKTPPPKVLESMVRIRFSDDFKAVMEWVKEEKDRLAESGVWLDDVAKVYRNQGQQQAIVSLVETVDTARTGS
jgi:hypothetical protein